MILLHSIAKFIQTPKTYLRFDMSLLGSFAKPLQRFLEIVLYLIAVGVVIHHSKSSLRLHIAGFSMLLG